VHRRLAAHIGAYYHTVSEYRNRTASVREMVYLLESFDVQDIAGTYEFHLSFNWVTVQVSTLGNGC
jgi:hypothetical protein